MKLLLSLLVGIGIGACGSYIYTKSKYENILEEEILSVKEVYSRKNKAKVSENNSKIELDSGKEKREVEKIIKNYTSFSDKDIQGENFLEESVPYIIPPEEFGNIPEYDCIELSYYTDGILTDDEDEPMDDYEIEETIGRDTLRRFGAYKDNTIHVRNDIFKCDYEILAQGVKYRKEVND